MPLIPFPDVPNLPGVPQLAQAIGAVFATEPQLLTGDDPSIQGLISDPLWGIFDQNGDPIATWDGVAEVEFAKDWRISDYPQEQGAFASYNKVETPYDVRVTVTNGQGVSDRGDFLKAIDDAVASLDLFTVSIPEITYVNANLVHYDFRRRGSTLIMVEIHLREVRVSGSLDFSNTASPSGANAQNGGTVQPQAPTAGVVAAVDSGIF